MRDETLDQVRRIWRSLDQADQQQVVEQFRQTFQEMINEHFRIGSVASPRAPGDDLCQAVESQPGGLESGEPTDAIRVA